MKTANFPKDGHLICAAVFGIFGGLRQKLRLLLNRRAGPCRATYSPKVLTFSEDAHIIFMSTFGFFEHLREGNVYSCHVQPSFTCKRRSPTIASTALTSYCRGIAPSRSSLLEQHSASQLCDAIFN
jgi:hypothetical protein